LTTGPVAAANGRFNSICHVAPVCTPPNNAFLGLPESKSQTDRFELSRHVELDMSRIEIARTRLRQVGNQVCDLDSIMEFGLYHTMHKQPICTVRYMLWPGVSMSVLPKFRLSLATDIVWNRLNRQQTAVVSAQSTTSVFYTRDLRENSKRSLRWSRRSEAERLLNVIGNNECLKK